MSVDISVIVPVYRLGAMAAACVASLRSQCCDFAVEILVLDDASPDDSWQQVNTAAAGDSRFRLLRNPGNQGLAANLGILLRQARGRFIAYMDGDDLALPGKLQALGAHLEQHADCSLVYHEAEVFDHDSGQTRYLYTRDHYNRAYVPDRANLSHLIAYGCFLNASAVMFRAHPLMAQVADCGCRILLDYPMHLLNVAALGGSIDFLAQPLGRYRLHAASSCAANSRDSQRRLQVLADQLQALDLLRVHGVEEALLQRGRCHHRFAAALFFLKQHEDRLFRTLVQAAAEDGLFFDDRHRFACANVAQPERVREALFPPA